ncbi:MAG: hypothetical protein KTR16_11715 [Acidiferrobacterales bacterium]|nr:hypothetical protein [Acidiferrobacterales bacterium]
MSFKKPIAIFLFSTLFLFFNAFAEPVWVDVRSALEYKVDNIEGDIRISPGDIVEELGTLYPDKETEVRLYCRSGGRAETALGLLQKAGYKNVLNMGGIDDAREERGIDRE